MQRTAAPWESDAARAVLRPLQIFRRKFNQATTPQTTCRRHVHDSHLTRRRMGLYENSRPPRIVVVGQLTVRASLLRRPAAVA